MDSFILGANGYSEHCFLLPFSILHCPGKGSSNWQYLVCFSW